MDADHTTPHPVFSSAWFGADVTKPETFNSVIVWGRLEDEYHLDAHEGFWCGRNWWSVRQNETDPMAKKKLSGVTHWMPRPQAPNDQALPQGGAKKGNDEH